jgi:hypothetical protein
MRSGSRPPDSPRALRPARRWRADGRRGRGRRLGLGIYLILPLPGVTVSAQAERIGGNYTNVTWGHRVCIAADGTLHLVSHTRPATQPRSLVGKTGPGLVPNGISGPQALRRRRPAWCSVRVSRAMAD